jgi:ATP-dependent Clp protease ATP-binding subunit ClpA
MPDKAIDLVDEACALIKTELKLAPGGAGRYIAQDHAA